MDRFKGVVKNNVVVFEEGVQLPEGTEVEVRVTDLRWKRQQAFERVRRNRITRPVGIDAIIEEDKREREERFP